MSTFVAVVAWLLIAALLWWLAWGEDWWLRVRAGRDEFGGVDEWDRVKDALR